MTDLRVLIVDSDSKLRSNAASLLRKRHYNITALASIEEFESEGSESSPDIVVCEMSRAEAVKAWLAEHFPRKQNIQFVLLFRNQSADKVLEAFHQENTDCLAVPFTERSLLLAIERAAESRDLIARNMRTKKRMEKAHEQLERNLGILEADAQAGRQMQQSLLPRSPIVSPPYYIARKIVPSLYLSGDFVNYLTALDNFSLFYLLDVSGHGASSAFVTVMVRQLMRRIVRRHVMDQDIEALEKAPQGFMERINQVLSDNDLEKHLTMFAGALNKETNTLRYAIGAQLPLPILVTEEGASYLEGKGKPIGLFTEGSWDVHEIQLPEKFILLAFSDGILEKLPVDGLQAQEDYLLERLASCPPDVDAVLPHLAIEDVDDLPDDIAVFMLARGYHEAE